MMDQAFSSNQETKINPTLQDASDLIQKKYAEQLLRPELLLNVIEPRPIRVSVLGNKGPNLFIY